MFAMFINAADKSSILSAKPRAITNYTRYPFQCAFKYQNTVTSEQAEFH